MRWIAGPHWIMHSHLFDPDEYECSRCGAVFNKKYPACPNCGTSLGMEKEEQDWDSTSSPMAENNFPILTRMNKKHRQGRFCSCRNTVFIVLPDSL